MPSDSSTGRMVQCAKFGELLPGLEKPPLRGPTGQLIYERISKRAWLSWKEDMQIKVLNEYRLNMGDPKDYQVMVDQMLKFLNLSDGQQLEVENVQRGRNG